MSLPTDPVYAFPWTLSAHALGLDGMRAEFQRLHAFPHTDTTLVIRDAYGGSHIMPVPDDPDPGDPGAQERGHPTWPQPLRDASLGLSDHPLPLTGALPPFPLNFGLMTGPRWTMENAYAWHRMTHETERHDMTAEYSVDLKATAARVFHPGSSFAGSSVVHGSDGSVYDNHPDVLYEFTHHGLLCPRNWFMVVPLTSTGLTPVMSVVRIQGSGEDERKIPIMRPGYSHPSPEYAAEVARQIHTGERDAFAWDTTANRWVSWPVASVLVFEHTGDGWGSDCWTQTHAFTDTDD